MGWYPLLVIRHGFLLGVHSRVRWACLGLIGERTAINMYSGPCAAWRHVQDFFLLAFTSKPSDTADRAQFAEEVLRELNLLVAFAASP